MTNKDYVEKYKLDNVIIVNKYSDEKGHDISGIVSPLKIDNRQTFSPIDFQKDTPHCAGFAAANLCESIIWKNTGRLVQLDAHQIYAKIDIEGTYPECTLQAALDLNVFNGKKFSVRTAYRSRRNSDLVLNIQHLVHKYDFLLAGFMITEDWYSCTKDNYVIRKSSGRNLGGHAVCIVGYNRTGVIIANSWSPSWGAKGFAIVSWDAFFETFMYASYLDPSE